MYCDEGLSIDLRTIYGRRELGTGNREQGTRNREQGTGNKEQGTGGSRHPTGCRHGDTPCWPHPSCPPPMTPPTQGRLPRARHDIEDGGAQNEQAGELVSRLLA